MEKYSPEGAVGCISNIKWQLQCFAQPLSNFWRFALDFFFSHSFQEVLCMGAFPRIGESQLLLAWRIFDSRVAVGISTLEEHISQCVRLCATRKGTSGSSGTCKLCSTVGHEAGEFSAFRLLCNCLQLWSIIFFSLLALSSSSTEVIIVLSMCTVRCHCQSLYRLWVILNRISVSPAPALPVLCGRLELSFGEVVISVMCLDHPLMLGLWDSNNIWPLCLF